MTFKKLVNTYKSLHIAVKASMWLLFCTIVQKMVSVLSVPIITRLLTTNEYGIYSTFISYSSILLIFGTLCLNDGGYCVGIKKYEDIHRYTSSVTGLMLTLVTGLFTVSFICRTLMSQITGFETGIIVMMFLWLYGQGAINLWFAKNKYIFQYRPIVISTICIALFTLALKVVFILVCDKYNLDKSEGVILGFVAPVFIVGVVAYSIIFLQGKKFYYKEYWQFSLLFNLPLIPYQLSQTLLMQADRIMIEQMDSASATGIYSVAYSLATAIVIINSSINSSLTPWQFQTMQKGENKRVAQVFNLLIVPVSLMHFLLIFLAPELMTIFASKNYHEAIYVVPPITISVMVMWMTQMFINVEFFYEKNKLLSVSSVMAAILNIILNIIYIPRFGYISAGYTTLVCYMANMIFHGFVAAKIINEHEVERSFDLRVIAIAVAGSTIFMLASLFLYQYAVVRYTILICGLIIFFIKRKPILRMIKEILKMIKEK